MSAEARDIVQKKKSRLVQVAPDDDAPDARHKLSPAKGLLIGAAICGAFWAAVAAVVANNR